MEAQITTLAEAELDYPKVKIEELDHSQEFFKEQHTTSFSYLPRKTGQVSPLLKTDFLLKYFFMEKPIYSSLHTMAYR